MFTPALPTSEFQETSAPPGGIQLSPSTAEALRDPPPGRAVFDFLERGEIVIKSKGTMMTYLLLGRAFPNSESCSPTSLSFAAPVGKRAGDAVVVPMPVVVAGSGRRGPPARQNRHVQPNRNFMRNASFTDSQVRLPNGGVRRSSMAPIELSTGLEILASLSQDGGIAHNNTSADLTAPGAGVPGAVVPGPSRQGSVRTVSLDRVHKALEKSSQRLQKEAERRKAKSWPISPSMNPAEWTANMLDPVSAPGPRVSCSPRPPGCPSRRQGRLSSLMRKWGSANIY